MLVEKGSKQAGKNVLRDGGGDSERQFAGNFAVVGSQVLFGFGNQSGDFLGVDEQDRCLAA